MLGYALLPLLPRCTFTYSWWVTAGSGQYQSEARPPGSRSGRWRCRSSPAPRAAVDTHERTSLSIEAHYQPASWRGLDGVFLSMRCPTPTDMHDMALCLA